MDTFLAFSNVPVRVSPPTSTFKQAVASLSTHNRYHTPSNNVSSGSAAIQSSHAPCLPTRPSNQFHSQPILLSSFTTLLPGSNTTAELAKPYPLRGSPYATAGGPPNRGGFSSSSPRNGERGFGSDLSNDFGARRRNIDVSLDSMHDTDGMSSFLQCVGCGAVYLVESEELEGEPRVVRCCTCLHEWYASEGDLLWGEREAAAAIESTANEREAVSTIAMQDVEDSGEAAAAESADESTDESDDIDGEGDENDDEISENVGDANAENGWQKDYDGFCADFQDPIYPDDESNDASAAVNTGRAAVEPDNMQPGSYRSGNIRAPRMSNYTHSRLQSFDSNRSGGDSSAMRQDSRSIQASFLAARSDSEDTITSRSYNIFVGNLSFHATEEDLFRAFSGYGVVLKCQIPIDAVGASRGYGFVEMSGDIEGERALESLQGACILGRDICLSKARRRGQYSDQQPMSRGTHAGTGDADRDRRGPGGSSGGRDNFDRGAGGYRRSIWNSRGNSGNSPREQFGTPYRGERVERSGKRVGSSGLPNVDDSLTQQQQDQLNSIFKSDNMSASDDGVASPEGSDPIDSKYTRSTTGEARKGRRTRRAIPGRRRKRTKN